MLSTFTAMAYTTARRNNLSRSLSSNAAASRARPISTAHSRTVTSAVSRCPFPIWSDSTNAPVYATADKPRRIPTKKPEIASSVSTTTATATASRTAKRTPINDVKSFDDDDDDDLNVIDLFDDDDPEEYQQRANECYRYWNHPRRFHMLPQKYKDDLSKSQSDFQRSHPTISDMFFFDDSCASNRRALMKALKKDVRLAKRWDHYLATFGVVTTFGVVKREGDRKPPARASNRRNRRREAMCIPRREGDEPRSLIDRRVNDEMDSFDVQATGRTRRNRRREGMYIPGGVSLISGSPSNDAEPNGVEAEEDEAAVQFEAAELIAEDVVEAEEEVVVAVRRTKHSRILKDLENALDGKRWVFIEGPRTRRAPERLLY